MYPLFEVSFPSNNANTWTLWINDMTGLKKAFDINRDPSNQVIRLVYSLDIANGKAVVQAISGSKLLGCCARILP